MKIEFPTASGAFPKTQTAFPKRSRYFPNAACRLTKTYALEIRVEEVEKKYGECCVREGMDDASREHDADVRDRLTMTVDEAAQALGISRGLAYDLVRRGELPALRLGGRLLVPVRQLVAMVDDDNTEPQRSHERSGHAGLSR